MDKETQEIREVTIDGFTYDLCDFCDEIATRGTISLEGCESYCNECYTEAHDWRRRK